MLAVEMGQSVNAPTVRVAAVLLQEVLPQLYELGYVKEPRESQAVPREVSVARAQLITPDVMVLMLQHLQYHKNLKNFLTELSSGAAAAADNPFNSDEYAIGASVQVLGDLDDADEDDPEQQPLSTIARGRIKQLASHTAAGVKLYEVCLRRWEGHQRACTAPPPPPPLPGPSLWNMMQLLCSMVASALLLVCAVHISEQANGLI